jgi:hypothetical protein
MCEQAPLDMSVYAGGDDPLAFVPASTALDAAQRCHDTVPQSLPSVSAQCCSSTITRVFSGPCLIQHPFECSI